MENKIIFCDYNVPKDIVFELKKRMRILGYKVLWMPEIKRKGIKRVIKESVSQERFPLVTFSREREVPEEVKEKVIVVYVGRRVRKSVNKLIAEIFTVWDKR